MEKANKWLSIASKLTPYQVVKGVRYLRHFGVKAFWERLCERMEPEEVPYGPWYANYQPTAQELTQQRKKAKAEPMTSGPVFSVIVPVYQTPERYLKAMLDSVLAQTYPRWELCLVNADPSDENVNRVLRAYQQRDRRIRVNILTENQGISGNTNAALKMAKGDWIALLDHDDELSPAALFQVARYLEEHRKEDFALVYTDEDKIRDAARGGHESKPLNAGQSLSVDATSEKRKTHERRKQREGEDVAWQEWNDREEQKETIEHIDPNLKPDFNLDLLRANNYICHLLCVRSDIAKAEGMDPLFDGAQDYDFIFRCAERAGYAHVGHVPEVLYHWRVHSASTSDNPLSKGYAYEAGRRAIEAHLARQGVRGAIVEQKKDFGFYRVRYACPETVSQSEDADDHAGGPLVSILIPNKDQAKMLRVCLIGIRDQTAYANLEVIIIENNSREKETLDLYKELARDASWQGLAIRIVRWKGAFNYAAINNYGARFAHGQYLLLLNNDIEILKPDWLSEMLSVCARPEVGAVGARLYYPDHTYQHAGIVIGIGGVAGSLFVDMKQGREGYLHKAALMQDLSAVTAACMLVRTQTFHEMGGFEEKLAVAFNDVDLCLRMCEKGYLVVYDPYAELIHHESKSRGSEDTKKKVRRFQTEIEYMRTRWERLLIEGDPMYNKNLSLHKWNYSLKDRERMR